MRPYVLLDRDDTLVRDVGYPHRVEDYHLLAGAGAALRRLAQAGYRLALVTNQSGIGRGYYGFAEFARFQSLLYADLAREGVAFDAAFLCPHRPDEGCACRKPMPGLVLRARDVLAIDLRRSWFVGDRESDVESARRAGCGGAVRVGVADPRAASDRLALEARDLAGAADAILRYGTP
ncbi:MAG: D,D-heptose 1,7-bisphosphate phosphatase [Proteobacteria bacterium]|nr:MAG: D,D-heptose 1,7-bisphosphate phosphatase [Pseudomonadota bacterium]